MATFALSLALVALALGALSGTAVAQDGSDPGSSSADSAAAADTGRRGNMTVLRDDSTLYAVTHRAGLFGFLGHEHAVTAESWSVDLCYLEDVDGSFISVTVPTGSVRLDTERGLELAGLTSSPDPDTVSDLQMQMLGPEFLHADMFPQLRFASTAVSRASGEAAGDAGDADSGTRDEAAGTTESDATDATAATDLQIDGELTIHGRSNPIEFPVRVERSDTGTFRFSAHVQFRMTDFGITPENTAGVVAVADEMDVYVDIAAQRTGNVCE